MEQLSSWHYFGELAAGVHIKSAFWGLRWVCSDWKSSCSIVCHLVGCPCCERELKTEVLGWAGCSNHWKVEVFLVILELLQSLVKSPLLDGIATQWVLLVAPRINFHMRWVNYRHLCVLPLQDREYTAKSLWVVARGWDVHGRAGVWVPQGLEASVCDMWPRVKNFVQLYVCS